MDVVDLIQFNPVELAEATVHGKYWFLLISYEAEYTCFLMQH